MKQAWTLQVQVAAGQDAATVIAEMQALGARVFSIPDGDVAASILTCMPDSEVDVLYGIGGIKSAGLSLQIP